MSLQIQCPGCSANLRAKPEMAGKRLKCPQCQKVLTVPPMREESPVVAVDKPVAQAANCDSSEAFEASDSEDTNSRPASVALRALGYLIDGLPTILLMPLILIPFLGQIMIGVLLCIYWLLRDIKGASLGKVALGCRVVSFCVENENDQRGRIIRNIPIAVMPLVFAVPVLGFVLAIVVGPVIVTSEIITLLITGRRLGDMLAGTTIVVRK